MGSSPPCTGTNGATKKADFLAKARRGIPQGSAVSTLIAESLLAPAITAVVGSVPHIVAYGDNVLVLAANEGDANNAIENLRLACQGLPAGPLPLRTKKAVHADGGFLFLGYAFQCTSDGPMIEPSYKNHMRLERKVWRLLEAAELSYLANDVAEGDTLLYRATQALNGWCGAFGLWPGIDEARADWGEFIKAFQPQCVVNQT